MVSLYIGMAVVWLVAVPIAAVTSCQKIETTAREYTLNVTDGYGAPDGFARPLFLVNGNTPGPIIEANQGEQLVVTVNNMLAVQIGMHWHGLHQRGTPQHDGVPGLNQYAIPPGGRYTYCFGTESNYGAYWYHVHLRDIYQDGVRGPILIQPNGTVERPYALISNKSDDLEAMQRAERTSSLLMVNDWFRRTSDEIALRMVATQDSMRPLCANSVLFNGMGRVDCPIDTLGRTSFGCEAMGDSMDMGSMSDCNKTSITQQMVDSLDSEMSGSMSLSKPAAIPPTGFSLSTRSIMASMSTMMMGADVLPTSTIPDSPSLMASSMPMIAAMSESASASMTMTMGMAMPSSPVPSSPMTVTPADDTCQNTTSPRYVLSFPENTTWNMLHVINAGASQQLALSFDEHDFWIVSADGAFVTPQKSQVINIGIGQRYAIMLRRPEGTQKVYTIRASTMTHQVFQSTALLSYGSQIADSSVQATSSPWIGVEGKPLNSTIRLMDDKALAPYPVEVVPVSNREIRLDVNQSNPTVWVLESGQPFASNNGQQTPLLFAPRNASGIFWLSKGDVVDVLLQVAVDSLDTMAHPIHLHGHYFRVLGSLANSTFPTNMSITDVATSMSDSPVGMALNTNSTAPRRDSAHLPEAGWLAIRFVADNPGVWLLHCHINSHLASGMAVAFIEAADDLPVFGDNITTPPQIAPLSSIPELQ